MLGFGTADTAYLNACLPGTLLNAIHPFWDDLYVEATPVCVATTGTAPNRRRVISWTAIHPYGDTGNMNIMVSLFETSNVIEIAIDGGLTSHVSHKRIADATAAPPPQEGAS